IGAGDTHHYRLRAGIRHRRLARSSERVSSRFVTSLIYKPIGLVLGIAAGLVGRRLFDFTWTKIDDSEPPKGITEETTWPKVIAAAALQGVIFKVTRVIVDRYGAMGWTYLTGRWPGEKRPDPDD